MGNINIGFHAQKDEVVKLINSIMLQYQLTVVAVKLWPDFEYQIIDTMKEEYLNSARFIFFSKETPRQLSNNYHEFLVQNAESLVLQIGERTEESMKESTIGTRATNSENIKLWKKVIKIFKEEMHQGVWVMVPKSGVKKYYKNHYFTIGAKNAYEKGVKMKAFAGINEYQLILGNQ
ncbi:hypothetical protein FIU87_01220 [Bacillus sp. THAF10]|uniref:hypothetical protein n=1 Tax=Bacillus sp. THAF10 TaxID=2587848 RepID=UPI001268E6A5|nr:hypothetical protein [Bacillus sp. THAF10]QFT87272.1 hypothetical protein FIU87_01220 [Bacillus sp. THAF10]